MRKNLAALAALVILSSGCYHATINTGLTPSTETIEQPWASGWIYGLVPPKAVETAQRCTNGVAKVETELSFANQLVTVLTSGIYTPMSIKVTCAQSRTSDASRTLRSTGDLAASLTAAAQLSAETEQPVLVEF